jgi:hypothetical protein
MSEISFLITENMASFDCLQTSIAFTCLVAAAVPTLFVSYLTLHPSAVFIFLTACLWFFARFGSNQLFCWLYLY